ncbi:MAG TPA: FeoA family protein, partial [Thermoclostridium sp.]|nr:FeoA family protein [Thermoclostridium sp.]
LDLGLVSNTAIEALQKSPSGDPTAYQIRGAVIALRKEDAFNILVEL